MKFQKKHILGIAGGLLLIILSFIFLRGENIFYFVIVLGVIIGMIPFVLSVMLESTRQKEVESRFLEFIRDLVENVKAGTPASKSIINLKDMDYGPLKVYIQKLANQISLGIPLNEALITFARDTKSPVISRAVSLIAEAERAGGKIDTILESVAASVNQIEVLKKERKSAIYNLVMQGYIIFMIFIVIMLVLQFKILPLVYDLSGAGGLSLSIQSVSPDASSKPLFILILVQSFFTGFVIGKISEGSFKDGIKHSFILLALTLIITTGVNAFFGA